MKYIAVKHMKNSLGYLLSEKYSHNRLYYFVVLETLLPRFKSFIA